MKKIYYIAVVFAILFLAGCGDGIDLPGVNVETDLNKIPLPDNNVNLEQVELKPSTEPMLHEGLHTEEDFQRIRDKKAAGEEPWVSAYQLLVESQFSQKTADTYPTEWIKRGVSGDENYMNAARGATIAYQQALRWKIEQDDEYAAKAVENLNKWVQTCVGVTGNTNLSLAAGLYGYEFAIAGELLRDYEGWDRADFAAFQYCMGARCRYICFGCCQRIGRRISIWFIDRSCCYDCFHLVLFGTGCETSARLKQIRLADFVVLCAYHWLDFCIVYVVCRWYGRS